MGFFDRFKLNKQQPGPTEVKESVSYATGSYSDMQFQQWLAGNTELTKYSYEAGIREGYNKCVVASKCIKLRADAFSTAKFVQLNTRTKKEDEQAPVLELLDRPNPMQSGPSFLETYLTYKDLDGNAFILKTGNNSRNGGPKYLYLIEPNRVTIEKSKTGIPAAYIVDKNKPTEREYKVDPITGLSDILHIKTPNPSDPWRGMGLMAAAWDSVQTFNAGVQHNKSSLENGATMGGIISFDKEMTLTEEQAKKFESKLSEKHSGTNNAGRWMILQGGTYQSAAMTLKDMEYSKSRDITSREIAMAFGVPPILLNIGGDATYANLKEARLDFYETTIMSELTEFVAELNRWLMPLYGPNLKLVIDMDSIPALETKQGMLWERLEAVSFLTQNEKRELAGFAPLEEEQEEEVLDEETDEESNPDANEQ